MIDPSNAHGNSKHLTDDDISEIVREYTIHQLPQHTIAGSWNIDVKRVRTILTNSGVDIDAVSTMMRKQTKAENHKRTH